MTEPGNGGDSAQASPPFDLRNCVDVQVEEAMQTGGWPFDVYREQKRENRDAWVTPAMSFRMFCYLEDRLRSEVERGEQGDDREGV
jgi:hypothetical protein